MTKSRQAYPTDLNDTEWQILEQYLPQPKTKRGRPRKHPWREILDAIFYIVRSGCAWSLLPHDFPPRKTVYHYFRRWRIDGTWEQLNTALREMVRVQAGRAKQPSAAVLDSQSVKTVEGGSERGYDAGKNVAGRKRHTVVDTLGLVLGVLVTAANVQDRAAAKLVLQLVFDRLSALTPWRWNGLKKIWADGNYRGELIGWVQAMFGWTLEIVAKLPDQVGFQVLPKRWLVERTFAWLNRQRRLSKDYERLPQTSEAFIYVAMTRLMLRRLAHAH
jgi:putative transposase